VSDDSLIVNEDFKKMMKLAFRISLQYGS